MKWNLGINFNEQQSIIRIFFSRSYDITKIKCREKKYENNNNDDNIKKEVWLLADWIESFVLIFNLRKLQWFLSHTTLLSKQDND